MFHPYGPRYTSSRADVFNGIMAAHIFPSLADVLTESLSADDFGPLDLSLSSMTGATADSRGLDESDFLNPTALSDPEDSNIYELSQPQDLLVHFPMWSVSQPVGNVDDSSELGQVQYEVEVPTDGSLTYPHSPGSTGDNSDYSSDSSGELNHPGKGMIALQRVSLAHRDPALSEAEVKKEPNLGLPDPSILPSKFYDDEDDVMSETDSDGHSSSSEKKKRPGRKKGQTSSVYHLWEFIRDLLHDERFCPKIIKWESEVEGIFRVVKSDEVAKQWGSKKNNRSKMTYEKLSRSLRYSRKEGYFADIPKDRGLPKKLCFKFGPKAHGWRKM
ncbi:ETS-related transcription factor Elf-3-like isoform X3 [Ostrea edulis]|uniref:ETS-related transcription factor Elf-3-like isoform X3 n=1 Tax=Ostrea edulis TaxID=37623 RepID=UPI002094F9EE|nr:ETS-related transcription factor Elf-3-like isoform X3 [Ostrea edulis]